MIEPTIVYLLLYFALIFGAIPLANFIHHFITAFCEASHATAVGGRIRYGHECAVSFTQQFLRDLPALALNLTLNRYLSALHLRITFRPQAMIPNPQNMCLNDKAAIESSNGYFNVANY